MRLYFGISKGKLEVTNLDGGPDKLLGSFGKLDRVRFVEFLRVVIAQGWDGSGAMFSSSMNHAPEYGWPDNDPEDFVRSCIREAGR